MFFIESRWYRYNSEFMCYKSAVHIHNYINDIIIL